MADLTPAVTGSGAVAGRAGMPRWLLLYRIERGDLPGPSALVAGRRLFTEADVGSILATLAARPELRSSQRKQRVQGRVMPPNPMAIDDRAGPGGAGTTPRPA